MHPVREGEASLRFLGDEVGPGFEEKDLLGMLRRQRVQLLSLARWRQKVCSSGVAESRWHAEMQRMCAQTVFQMSQGQGHKSLLKDAKASWRRTCCLHGMQQEKVWEMREGQD